MLFEEMKLPKGVTRKDEDDGLTWLVFTVPATFVNCDIIGEVTPGVHVHFPTTRMHGMCFWRDDEDRLVFLLGEEMLDART